MRPLLALLPLPALIGQAPLLTQDQFTAKALELARKTFPSLTTRVPAPLTLLCEADGKPVHQINLDNAFAEYQQRPDQLDRVLEHYLTSVQETSEAAKGMDPSRIVPLVRPTAMLQSAIRDGKGKVQFVYDSLGDDLSVVYALDQARAVKYLHPSELKTSGIDAKELRKRSALNLMKMLGEPATTQQDGVLFFAVKDGYESSLLAVPQFCESLRARIKGDIVLAVPARNWLLVTSATNTGQLEKLARVAANICSESDHPISPFLYVLKDGSLKRFIAE